MYERTYGYRYTELGEYPSAAEIAKAMRHDIKQAVTDGLLPAHWSYSVRSDTFSGGCSVNITVRDCPDAWWHRPDTCTLSYCPACASDLGCDRYKLTPDAESARITLQRIHNAYNHDGSEVQTDYFDVRYYGNVTFEDARSAEFRASEKSRKAERRASTLAATDRRKIRVYGRNGSTVHVAASVDGKIRLLCGAQLRQFSLTAFAPDAAVTCSRCSRHEVQS